MEQAFEFFRIIFSIMSGVSMICLFISVFPSQDLRDEWIPILLGITVLNIFIASILNNVKNSENESETWKVGEAKP